MRKRKIITSLSLLIFPSIFLYSQSETRAETKSKSGWGFGALPVIAYETDIGLKYGGLVNLYHYGDGTIYPNYKHSIYLEWSRTTKGSGINQITYDSKYLIPGLRTSAEASFLTERSLDFYGYNGYKSYYSKKYEDASEGNPDYLSRQFYRQERKLLRLRVDFMGKLTDNSEHWQWLAGIVHYNVKLDTIDVDKLNEGTPDNDKLPYINGGLYGKYKEWGVIPGNEYYGGISTVLKAGFAYDTRDNEPNPMSGVWTEAFIILAPGIFGKNDPSYSKFSVTHRQYFTIFPNKLSFVYRVAYQGKLHNTTPSYMLPIIFLNGRNTDKDGLGGSKTLRGILRNRVVGEDVAFGNFEFRWKFLQKVVFNQNIYIALSAFSDLGIVTREYKINTSNVPSDPNNKDNPDLNGMLFFTSDENRLHQSIGSALHFALNENFIVAFEYGTALNEKDGDSGFYINLNWLF